ncbi:CCR4-not transcription complex [Entamoeba marina]
MKGTLFQIRQVVANLSRKNNRQSTLELSHLINQTGLHGQLFYIKSLITTITSESEIRECFKLQTLREELSKLAKSSDVNFFRTELSQLNLSDDVIKALKLSPDAEYILNQNPQQPTLLSQNCLFDYLCEHSNITIDKVTHEEPIFSRCWKEPVSCSISIPPIHGVSKEIIGKLAWNCTGSYNTFNTLLNDVHGSKMSYNDVAELLIVMMTYIERQQNMSERSGGVISPQQNIASKSDAKIIASVLKERCKDWNIIASVMDSKAYECKHHEAALFLVRIFQYVDVFPLDSFFTKIWMNRKAQGCIVHAFVSIASGNKEESGYLLKQLTSAFGKNSVRGIRGLWESTNFVERIIDIGLSASADFDQIYSLTDVVLPMLCKCKPTASRQRAIVATLRQCPQLSNVIHPLWKNYKLLLAQGLRDRYLEDPSKIEDIINAVPGDDAGKVLTTLNPTSFALDVACLLTKKNLLNFEKWICEQKTIRGMAFGRQIVSFIKDKHSMTKTTSPHPLDKNVLTILLIRASSMGQQQECHRLEQQYLTKPTKKESLDNRANDMFGCYFERKYTVEHFVDEMIKARDSQDPVENDFYVLLVKSLFEEFKRIKDFSKHDAAVLFGELYGEMVNRKVLTYCSLIHMLRIILYAVAKPIQSNYFHCGINALQRFKERLYEWPSYCCQLKEISSIEIKDPSLYAIISSHANSKFAAVMNLIQHLLRSIRFETLLDACNVSVIKSLSTLFANLPSMKLSTVYAEIENVFNKTKPSQKHRNILIETSLFITALTHENTQKDCIRLKQHMNQTVGHLLNFTIDSIKIFLKRREYDKQSAILFGALGELLGLLTLDLNKPLLYQQLSPRLLLTDQLTTENFDVMLEFVIRFLKGCEHSIVFTPNNPWISPLLQIVAKTSISPELASHHESAKQLLQSLNVDAEQYLLEHSPKPSFTEAIQKLQKFSRERNSDESGVFTEFIETHQPIPINKLRQVLLSDKSLAYSKELSDLPILSLPQSLICPSLGLEHWMVIVKCCLDFALQDICKTVSVSMDCIIATVKQLIQKDFATETDVSKISAAADRVFLLAQKLLQYTCRSCLDTKLWKYIAHYVAISNKQQSYIKQQDYFKQPEQMKEMVMSNLHPQMEKAVSIKLAELRNSAQRQLSNFISEITPEREEAIAKGNKKFIAKGFEYLLDGPDLPPSLKIAYGGVTDEQMSLYAGGVSADVINKIDDKFVEMLSEPIHFDIVSKYVRLMPFTMIDSITKKLIGSIIQYPSVVRADRAVEILAIIFHSLKMI